MPPSLHSERLARLEDQRSLESPVGQEQLTLELGKVTSILAHRRSSSGPRVRHREAATPTKCTPRPSTSSTDVYVPQIPPPLSDLRSTTDTHAACTARTKMGA